PFPINDRPGSIILRVLRLAGIGHERPVSRRILDEVGAKVDQGAGLVAGPGEDPGDAKGVLILELILRRTPTAAGQNGGFARFFVVERDAAFGGNSLSSQVEI